MKFDPTWIKENEIVVVTGPRKTGKSTAIAELMQLVSKGVAFVESPTPTTFEYKNADWLILFRTHNIPRLKEMHRSYGSKAIEDFNVFMSVMLSVCRGYDCLVIKKNGLMYWWCAPEPIKKKRKKKKKKKKKVLF